MRLEKREVTLNEKDALLDMIFFEEALQEKYRSSAEKVEGKEMRATLLNHADQLEEKIEKLKQLFKKPPKM
jgi:ferritin-like metal-binding protein YciE